FPADLDRAGRARHRPLVRAEALRPGREARTAEADRFAGRRRRLGADPPGRARLCRAVRRRRAGGARARAGPALLRARGARPRHRRRERAGGGRCAHERRAAPRPREGRRRRGAALRPGIAAGNRGHWKNPLAAGVRPGLDFVHTDEGAKFMAIDIGIPQKERSDIAQGLSRMLADTYLLYLKTHNFHWNVEGPMFQTLHTMFMGQYTEAWNAIDPIAERIRALGHYAPGTYKEYLKLGSIKETDGVPKAEKMVQLLIAAQEAVVRTARSVLPLAEEANDQPTLDLLTQRMDIHEKNAWMLRSLLKK